MIRECIVLFVFAAVLSVISLSFSVALRLSERNYEKTEMIIEEVM